MAMVRYPVKVLDMRTHTMTSKFVCNARIRSATCWLCAWPKDPGQVACERCTTGTNRVMLTSLRAMTNSFGYEAFVARLTPRRGPEVVSPPSHDGHPDDHDCDLCEDGRRVHLIRTFPGLSKVGLSPKREGERA